jgi:hypothetical protein
MKLALALLFLSTISTVQAQVWKTLPKGVRILGYRNVITSKVTSNFNQFRSESPLGAQFKIDANTINAATGTNIAPSDLSVGSYKVDASAQFNVKGTGFGYGITDNIMFYGEIAYYTAQVNTDIKRIEGNTYAQAQQHLASNGNGSVSNDTLVNNIGSTPDINEKNIQSYLTNQLGYKPLGNWTGSGFGDMETGVMAKVIDKGTWGLLLYPGVVLPTGRTKDPNMLQDVAFGDGQYDFFSEMATGYLANDQLSFGTTFRYTYQAPTQKTLRIPDSADFPLSANSGSFNVKYGDRVNWMVNSTYKLNDWFAITPTYRFMYQLPSKYDSQFSAANGYLSANTDKQEHQVQLTTTLSSITPFLKKEFLLPAQINFNIVQTVAGKNVPKVGRFEIEFRMLF